MPPARRPLLVVAGVLAVLLTIAGCSEGSSSTAGAGATPSTAASVELSAEAVVVDVRTPEEYAAGHVEGAVNIDVQAPDFADRLEALDAETPTYVYCRTGNRSAAAAAQMTEAGFTDVTDLGGLEEASEATGLPIVP